MVIFAVLAFGGCHRTPAPAATPAVVVALPAHSRSGAGADESIGYPVEAAARYSNAMSFRVAGKLIERTVRLCDSVHKGQVSARLDTIDAEKRAAGAQAAFDAAEHRLVFAKQQLDRDQAQFAQNLIATNQMEQTQDAYAAALAGREQSAAQRMDLGAGAVPEWWKAYQSATLDALVEEGLNHSPSLAAARHTLQAAREGLRSQIGQSMVPSVDLGFNSARQRALGIAMLPQQQTFLYNVFAAEVKTSYTFDFFGAALLANRALALQVKQQAYQLEATRRGLAANIVVASINAASLQEQVAATEQLVALGEQRARQVAARYRLGSASNDDLLSVAQDAADAAATLPALRAKLLAVRHAQAVLLGRTPDQAPMPLSLDELNVPDPVLAASQNVADTLVFLDEDANTLVQPRRAATAAYSMLRDTESRYRLDATGFYANLGAGQQYQNVSVQYIRARAARLADTATLFDSMGNPSLVGAPRSASAGADQHEVPCRQVPER